MKVLELLDLYLDALNEEDKNSRKTMLAKYTKERNKLSDKDKRELDNHVNDIHNG